MRRSFLMMFMLVMTIFFVAQTASAQLIKIPKIPKAKPQPTPTETAQPAPSTDSESAQPEATTRPPALRHAQEVLMPSNRSRQ